jgi:hypothetical protein
MATDKRTLERLHRFVEAPDGEMVEPSDGLQRKLIECPAEPLYVKRRGRLVLIGWQHLLPGVSTLR